MPRKISWETRLNDIHRRVMETSRDPYFRADVEDLFKVEPPTAKKLMQLMERTEAGKSAAVAREDLLSFLDACQDARRAGRLSEHIAELRAKPPKPRRRKLRVYIPRDFDETNLRSITPFCRMKRGGMEILYTTKKDWAAKMMIIAKVAGDSLEFERRYCDPEQDSAAEIAEKLDAAIIRAEGKYLAKIHAAVDAVAQGLDEIAGMLRTEADAVLVQVNELHQKRGTRIDDDEVFMRAVAKLAELTPPPAPDTPAPLPEAPASEPAAPSESSTADPPAIESGDIFPLFPDGYDRAGTEDF